MKKDVLEILKKLLDSNDATVGGGAGSALASAIAASTISMVAKLSMKKPVNFDENKYKAISEDADKLSIELQNGCIKDREAYCQIVEAFKLPKSNDVEITQRKNAIQLAAVGAAEVPRDNGNLSVRVWKLGKMLLGNSNPACLSDLLFAIYMAESAIKDCALNIEANLSLIKDETIVLKFKVLHVFFGSIPLTVGIER
ncbi:MAG: cyclodeaminase/cyclohydrolase family protein [Acidaminococcus sp.]|jgi:formiminotetrahydrofolate cyclodeaminase|nr:cyclodeaminase/cyclohydrolase family protein [Acidaminococcus sp.]